MGQGAVEGAVEGAVVFEGNADFLGGLFGSFAWQVALWAALSVLALWAFSVVGTIVQYGGFKVRRRESRIEVEHGLLQRTFHGVDIDRVQTVIVKQSFVRRLIGCASFRQDRFGCQRRQRGAGAFARRGDPSVRKNEPRAR
ncbi:MAG: PH domain-containing protein [Eggerthellaceae bacterium]